MSASAAHLRAVGFALMGFAAWVLSDSFMKLTGETSLPPYETVAFLGLFACLFMLMKAAPSGQINALWPKNPRNQLGRGILALICNIANVIALKHLPLTMFYATVFAAPMVIALLASLCLRERLTLPKIAAIIIGFGGVIVAINPFRDMSQGDVIGYAAAATGAACFSVSVVWLRVMTQSESPDSLAFFTGFIEGVAGFGAMLFLPTQSLNLNLIGFLIGMGFFCVVGNLLIYAALRMTAAATVAQFHYTQIITGALIGYVIWRDIPAWHTVLGIAIIIASGLYIAVHGGKAQKLAVAEKV